MATNTLLARLTNYWHEFESLKRGSFQTWRVTWTGIWQIGLIFKLDLFLMQKQSFYVNNNLVYPCQICQTCQTHQYLQNSQGLATWLVYHKTRRKNGSLANVSTHKKWKNWGVLKFAKLAHVWPYVVIPSKLDSDINVNNVAKPNWPDLTDLMYSIR